MSPNRRRTPGFPCSQVNAGAYAFEAANARHEHEYHILGDGKAAGRQSADSGRHHPREHYRRHPELIAERIARLCQTRRPGKPDRRQRLRISSQATYNPEVHPKIVWAKFRAMAEGARLATRQLWR